MKYCVTVARNGWLFVEAETKEEAMDIANHQTTDTVNWSEDWEPTDCVEDSTILGHMCVREKAFE